MTQPAAARRYVSHVPGRWTARHQTRTHSHTISLFSLIELFELGNCSEWLRSRLVSKPPPSTSLFFISHPTAKMGNYDEPDVVYRGYMIPLPKFNDMMKQIPSYKYLMVSEYGEHSHHFCYSRWKNHVLDEKLRKRAPKVKGALGPPPYIVLKCSPKYLRTLSGWEAADRRRHPHDVSSWLLSV